MLVLALHLAPHRLKFKFLDMARGEIELAAGSYSIGLPSSRYASPTDVLEELLKSLELTPDAIGLHVPHGGPISSPKRVTDELLNTIRQYADLAPINLQSIALMQALRDRLPKAPQVAVFDTAFHHTIPQSHQVYALPPEWTESPGIRRYGAHGVSHQYAGMRARELVSSARRLINCHLDESSSICAMDQGRSIDNSSGFTPLSGLPQLHAAGNCDATIIPRLLKHGLSLQEILHKLNSQTGLLAIAGLSGDWRDIELAAELNNPRATLAIDVLAESVRHFIGAYLVSLGGCDVLTFTGAIGENSPVLRSAICRGLAWAGIELDPNKNNSRGIETKISSVESDSEIWILPANEELLIAEQTAMFLEEPLN